MEDKQVNTFSKGMNLDIDKSILPNDMYRKAINVRLMENGDEYIAEDIMGNEFAFSIPEVTSLFYIQRRTTPGTGTSTVVTIKYGLKAYIHTFAIDAPNMFEQIALWIDSLNINGLLFAYNDERVALVSTGTVAFQVGVMGPNFERILVHPQLYGLRIIGDHTERDQTFLWTTALSMPGTGQIWMLENNKVQLLYDGMLDLSMFHLINARSYAYNDEALKLYFTDGSNWFRHCNALDPNLLALDPDDFVITSKINLPNPKIVQLGSGNLMAGVIQYAYQLYNKYGSQTYFSHPTYLINLTESSEKSGTDTKFKGTPKTVNAGKSVQIQIDGIPPGFDYIRVVSIFYDEMNGVPNITYVSDAPCPSNGTYKFIDSGFSLETISIEEFNIIGRYNFKSKDLDQKDNILFHTNITEEYVDVDFDARAFRFKRIGSGNNFDCYVKDTQGNALYVNYSTLQTTTPPEKHDCIQSKADQFNYKLNPINGHLGGAGKNISYDFVIIPVKLDNGTTLKYPIGPKKDSSELSPEDSVGVNVYDSTKNESFANYSSPYFKQYVGYQDNEVYRFGIRFKKGHLRTFVKHIADIKFPSPREFDYKMLYQYQHNNTTINANEFFPYSNVLDTTNETWGYNIFPRFVVNNIPDGWEYEIVRMPRLEGDRTVIATGDVHPLQRNSNNVMFPVHPNQYNNGSLGNIQKYHNIRRFDSAETIFNKPQVREGDSLILYYKLNYLYTPIDNSAPGDAIFYKDHRLSPAYNGAEKTILIKSSAHLDTDEKIVINGITVNNNWDDLLANTTAGRNFVLETEDWDMNFVPGQSFYAHIERDLIQQYGGAGYEERTNSEYSSLYQLDSANGRVVFDGDTYTNFCEKLDAYKAHDSIDQRIQITSFISKSTINTTYRTSEQFKTNENVYIGEFQGVRTIDNVVRTQDDDYYVYNTAYSIENRVELCYPQPLHFKAIKEYDNRVIGSELKQSDNVIDTWLIYKPSTYIDAQKAFGPCNAIRLSKDRLYLFQDRAISIPSINERVPLNIDSPLGFVMGTGGVLVRLDYISNHQGTRHQRSIISTQYGLFFYCSSTKNILLVGGGLDSITETKGVKSRMIGNTDLLNRLDNTRTGFGINGFYDINNRELVYSFHDEDEYTLAFNSGIFNGYHSYISPYYFTQNDKVYSVYPSTDDHDQEKVYQHNIGKRLHFYDEQHYLLMQIVVNKNHSIKKTFDGCNMNFNSYNDKINQFEDFFDTIKCWNDYQNSGARTFVKKGPNDIYASPHENFYARRDRTHSFYIPRNIVAANVGDNPDIQTTIDFDKDYKERMKDKYLVIELIYSGENQISFPFIITKFRY